MNLFSFNIIRFSCTLHTPHLSWSLSPCLCFLFLLTDEHMNTHLFFFSAGCCLPLSLLLQLSPQAIFTLGCCIHSLPPIFPSPFSVLSKGRGRDHKVSPSHTLVCIWTLTHETDTPRTYRTARMARSGRTEIESTYKHACFYMEVKEGAHRICRGKWTNTHI